jgi:hypothetical protein
MMLGVVIVAVEASYPMHCATFSKPEQLDAPVWFLIRSVTFVYPGAFPNVSVPEGVLLGKNDALIGGPLLHVLPLQDVAMPSHQFPV